MSDSDYDPNSSGEEWSGADDDDDNDYHSVALAPAVPVSALGGTAGAADDEEDEDMQDGLMADKVRTGQAANQRDLQKRGLPPMFHSQHAVAHATTSLTLVAKPYHIGHAYGAAIGAVEGTLAEGPVTVSFAFVNPDLWNAMYASAVPSSRFKLLPSAACAQITQMHAAEEEAADVCKFYMALDFPHRYTIVVARSYTEGWTRGHMCLVLRAGRVFTQFYRPGICKKPTRFAFNDIVLDEHDIHERKNHADINTEMAQLVRRTATKALAVPQGNVPHGEDQDNGDATLTNKLLAVCTVGHLSLQSQTAARQFVAQHMRRGNAMFFLKLGRPDGQTLQRKNIPVSDETKWPMARLEVNTQGLVTVPAVVLALARMDYASLFQVLMGLDDVYANIALAALQYKHITAQESDPTHLQRDKIVAFAASHYRVDAEGRIYPKTVVWWAFKAINVSRMLASTDSLRECNGALLCGPQRNASVVFRFRMRRSQIITTQYGPRTFDYILLSGREITTQGARFTALEVVWHNILHNGLLPLLESPDVGGAPLTPNDLRDFFRNYTPHREQLRRRGRMDRPDEERVLLMYSSGRPCATLRPFTGGGVRVSSGNAFHLLKAAPRTLGVNVRTCLTMHDGHGVLHSSRTLTFVDSHSPALSTADKAGVFNRLEASGGYNAMFLVNIRAMAVGQTATFRRGIYTVQIRITSAQPGHWGAAAAESHPRYFQLLESSRGIKFPLGEYHETGVEEGHARMVLCVVDKDYDTSSHGGGSLHVQLCGVRPVTFFHGPFVTDAEATKMVLDHELEQFRARTYGAANGQPDGQLLTGPEYLEQVFARDFVRNPAGTIGPRESPIDPDTCLLRENANIELEPSRAPPYRGAWDCMLCIQSLSGHRPWRVGFVTGGSTSREICRTSAMDMCMGAYIITSDPCGVFPASLLGRYVPRNITWAQLRRFVVRLHNHQTIEGGASRPPYPKLHRGRYTGVPRLLPPGSVSPSHDNFSLSSNRGRYRVVFTQRCYAPAAADAEDTWLGNCSKTEISSEMHKNLHKELFRPALNHRRDQWTVGRIWGCNTRFLPPDVKQTDIRNMWRWGAKCLQSGWSGYNSGNDTPSMVAYMHLQLRARYNMRGRVGHEETEGLLSALRSHEEAAGILPAVEAMLSEQAPTIMDLSAPRDTCGMRGKKEVATKTLIRRLRNKGANNWKHLWEKKKKRKRNATVSITCPVCLGSSANSVAACSECKSTGKKRIRVSDEVQVVAAPVSPLQAYEQQGKQVVDLSENSSEN